MRSEVLAYLETLDLGSYKLSRELPFSNSGVALPIKNAKRIYVDRSTVTTEPFIRVLGGRNIDNEIQTVRVTFANDSKNQPQDYDVVVQLVKGAKEHAAEPEHYERVARVETEFEGDLQVTTIELQFTKLLPH